MILATDLDGTFLGGKSIYKQELYRLIRKNTSIRLVFVTGRGLETVIPLLNDPIIPNPDYIICDVGATIVNGHTLEPIEPLQNRIEEKWPGVLRVREALQELEGLEYQEVPQQRRCSFLISDENKVKEIADRIKGLGCDLIYSVDTFLDVMPAGVNKGNTLKQLVQLIGGEEDEVLVAGDTLNDLAMYACGYKGVVVGNAEEKLVHATADIPGVYHAKEAGAGGILEAIRHFAIIPAELLHAAMATVDPATTDSPQIVMMYHRFPYEVRKQNGRAERVTPASPNGILPTLQNFFSSGRSGVWIAWEEVDRQGDLLRNIYIDKDRYPNLMASRIGLTKKEIDIFYKTFAKEAFWPTIFSFIDKAKFNHQHWDHFVEINRRFAQKACEQADTGAMIWLHDYNLWLVPGLLRELRPDLRIGFFHHTAFPAANTFNILPWRREIISSLLQCDYIGFHIPRYVENFVDVVKSLYPVEVLETVNCAPRFLTYSTALGVDKMTISIRTAHRTVRLGANPVGINLPHIRTIMQREETKQKIQALREQFGDRKVILSVERLDYVKGPLEKVLAFEEFLKQYPEFHGKVELIQICTPPARGMRIYEKIQHDVEQAVGRINGTYSSIDWIPIRFITRAFPFEEVLTYYAVADIAWITPLRDGLNLVAKEYVAAQGQLSDPSGVLILSEFAGSAVELPYAIRTNPYDTRSMKEGLLQALMMAASDRELRMRRLYDQVKYYDVDFWATDFLQQLRGAEFVAPQMLASEESAVKTIEERLPQAVDSYA